MSVADQTPAADEPEDMDPKSTHRPATTSERLAGNETGYTISIAYLAEWFHKLVAADQTMSENGDRLSALRSEFPRQHGVIHDAYFGSTLPSACILVHDSEHAGIALQLIVPPLPANLDWI